MNKKDYKIFAILVAYNAEKALKKFYKNFPKHLFDEIILVDDASPDNTYELALELGIRAYKNQNNLGYGGNMKRALNIALDEKADIIVDLHPDGEYKPSAIEPALKQMRESESEFVLGTRFTDFKQLIKSGIFFWKIPVIVLLNYFPRLFFKTDLNDLHQGFRVYSKNLLNAVNFNKNSDNFIFSFQIIVQAIAKGICITQVPVETSYEGKKRGASLKNSVVYTIEVFKVLFLYTLYRIGFKVEIFDNPENI